MFSASAFRRGFLLLLIASPLFALPPRPSGYLDDLAGVLPPDAAARLTESLNALERDTTDEMAVVTVPSLEGLTVEDYAEKLFKSWGIGKKGKDNGVLVLVCPPERKMRIEVGYGLEAVLPDGLAGQVIREDFIPGFKAGDYPSGIERGAARVVNILRKNEPAPAAARRSANLSMPAGFGVLGLTAFFAVFVGLGAFFFGVGFGARVVFLGLWGGMFGGIPLVMAQAMAGMGPGRWFLRVLALVLGYLGYRLGRRSPKSFRGAKGASSGGWMWGGGGGSGGSSGGSSGGGFGGGSSGGGGASGSW